MNNLIEGITGLKCANYIPYSPNLFMSKSANCIKIGNNCYAIDNKNKILSEIDKLNIDELWKTSLIGILTYLHDAKYLRFNVKFNCANECRNVPDILEKIFYNYFPFDVINIIGDYFKLKYLAIKSNNKTIFIIYGKYKIEC